MARIRSIKPEFYRHYDLYSAEVEYGLPLRLAFSGLWLCSDKEGRFKWKPVQLKLDVLPYDNVDFLEVLIALAETGFIKYYESEGKGYGFIPTFKDHQRITGSEATAESKLPCPPTTYDENDSLEKLRKQQGNTLDDKEGKGKGRERERERVIGKGEDFPEKISYLNPLQKIYDKSWEEYQQILNGQSKKLSEIIFIKWKEFVDFIWENNYQEIFTTKFISPIDFGELLTKKKFLPDKWKPVIEAILATGVTPQQNLFFRIPQYMDYGNAKNNRSSIKNGGGLSATAIIESDRKANTSL